MHPIIHQIAFLLVIIGAINWGIIGAFGINFVARLFGEGTPATRVIYILLGISAIILLVV